MESLRSPREYKRALADATTAYHAKALSCFVNLQELRNTLSWGGDWMRSNQRKRHNRGSEWFIFTVMEPAREAYRNRPPSGLSSFLSLLQMATSTSPGCQLSYNSMTFASAHEAAFEIARDLAFDCMGSGEWPLEMSEDRRCQICANLSSVAMASLPPEMMADIERRLDEEKSATLLFISTHPDPESLVDIIGLLLPQAEARTIGWKEANVIAERLFAEDPNFAKLGVRKGAAAIGCKVGVYRKTPFWARLMAAKGPAKGRPSVVSLSSSLESTLGENDEALEALIREQSADFEDSPLVNSRRRPVVRRN